LYHRQSEDDGLEYYTKWSGLDYNECEWEAADLINQSFAHKVKEFEDRRKRAKQLRRLSEKPVEEKLFTPYTIQPAFLPLKLHKYQLIGLNWLRQCFYSNTNNMLADEMVCLQMSVSCPID